MQKTGHVDVKEPFKGLFTQGMVVHETYKRADGTWASPAEVNVEGEGVTLDWDGRALATYTTPYDCSTHGWPGQGVQSQLNGVLQPTTVTALAIEARR